jgi:hypothetical protein
MVQLTEEERLQVLSIIEDTLRNNHVEVLKLKTIAPSRDITEYIISLRNQNKRHYELFRKLSRREDGSQIYTVEKHREIRKYTTS